MKTLKATLSAFLSLSFFIAAPGIAFAADAPPRPDIPTDSRYAKVYQEDQETIAEINRNLPHSKISSMIGVIREELFL